MRAAKVDRNHAEIVEGLRDYGCSVISLAALGKGVPDILVGWGPRMWLMEIKDGSLCKSKRQLRGTQIAWHDEWRGPAVHTVLSLDQAIEIVTI